MDTQITAMAIIPILTIILVTFGWRILNWLWITPRKKERMLRKQGFKGNPYTLKRLFFGDTKENSAVYAEALGKAINIHDEAVPRVMPFIHKTIEKYGKQSFVWVGPRPRVLVNDPELMKTVMNNYGNFVKHFKVSNNIVQTIVTGIITNEGKVWSKNRGTFRPVFQLEKLKKMIPGFQAASEEIMSEWEELVSKDGSRIVDVFPYLESLTSRVVSKTLFATDYAKDKKLIYELVKQLSPLAGQTTRLVELPGERGTKQIMSELRKTLKAMMKERAEKIKAGQTMEDNCLHTLLRAELAESHGHIGNLEDAFGHALLFYSAGYESTAISLVWIMIMLSIHTDWQERARQEAFQVFGDRKPDYEGISQLKVITMIINEVLRLYPPIVEASRLVEEDTQLGEYTIPADTLLMLPIVVLHRDPEYWGEDANKFNPTRFSEGVMEATKGRLAFFPFGWGPRVCIGQNFSLMEIKLVLANMLRRFSFELSPTYAHTPYVLFTVQPQTRAPLVICKLR